MKMYLNLLILLILDFTILWFLIKWLNPDSSTSIALIYLIPIVVILNLIIAVILYCAKATKGIINLFVINSIISALLTFILFVVVVNTNQDKRQKSTLEEWTFRIDSEVYEIKYFKNDKMFEINRRIDQYLTVGIMEGTADSINGELKFRSDTLIITIKDGHVYGFKGNEVYKVENLNYAK